MIKYEEITSNAISFIKSKFSWIIILSLVFYIFTVVDKENPKESVVIPDVIIEAPILKPIEKAAKEACETETKIVMETNQLFDVDNLLVLDLSTFELFKTKRIDNKRVGYYYRRAGAVKEYYTVFRIEPKPEETTEFIRLEK